MTLPKSAAEQLRQIVEGIESIEAEIKDAKELHKEKYAEAKSSGFDVKIIRKIIARRKRPKSEVQEEEALLDTYLKALEGTPMGDYLRRQEEAHA